MKKQNCTQVIVLYMGGTFGCVGTPLAPMPASIFVPKLQALVDAQQAAGQLNPALNIDCRAAAVVKDSAACDASDWLNLALMLQALCAQGYEHVVLIHGTDTLSYAAALLSRVFKQQLKLMITGSQQPLFEPSGQALHTRSDAWQNFKFALEQLLTASSGCYVAFANQLINGQQSFKLERNAWSAFANTQSQAELTHHLKADQSASESKAWQISPADVARVQQLYIATLVLLPLQPQASLAQLESLLSHPPDFLIVQAYGCGNFALSPAHLQCLTMLQAKNCLCVLSSQVPFGQMQQIYAINAHSGSFAWLMDNSASPADLYAKIVQIYLQYPSVAQRQHYWYQ